MAARPPSRRILRPNTIFHDLASTQSATSANERRRKPVFRRGVQVGARKRRVKRLVPGGKPGVGGRSGEALARGATGLWDRPFCWACSFQARAATPDLFRGLLRGEERGWRGCRPPAARWTPEQVRGDGSDEGTIRTSLLPLCASGPDGGTGVDGDSLPSADLPSPPRRKRHISGKGAFAVNAMISSMIDRPADRPQSR